MKTFITTILFAVLGKKIFSKKGDWSINNSMVIGGGNFTGKLIIFYGSLLTCFFNAKNFMNLYGFCQTINFRISIRNMF